MRLERAGTEIVVSVRDTGQGILTDRLLHKFDRFYRRADRGKRSGLFITKEIVENPGGDIKVQSEQDIHRLQHFHPTARMGILITIYLPEPPDIGDSVMSLPRGFFDSELLTSKKSRWLLNPGRGYHHNILEPPSLIFNQ